MPAHRTRFHIKIDQELKDELIRFCHGVPISRVLDGILTDVAHLVEKKDFETESAEFPGEPEQTADLYLTMRRKYKNKLFQIQEHFKLRSKASVLRLLIRVYIRKIKMYGLAFLKKILKRSAKLWTCEKRKKRCWIKGEIHMGLLGCPYAAFWYTEEGDLLSIASLATAFFP